MGQWYNIGTKGTTTMRNTDTKRIIYTNRANPKDFDLEETDWEGLNENLREWIQDEYANLNKPIDGVIVGFADLGLWNGHRNGGKVFDRSNANSIFSYGEDYNEWYGDGKDIRGTFTHHDGTNTVLFRIAESRKEAESLVEKIAYGGMTEEEFCAATKSLYPVVAEVYGW